MWHTVCYWCAPHLLICCLSDFAPRYSISERSLVGRMRAHTDNNEMLLAGPEVISEAYKQYTNASNLRVEEDGRGRRQELTPTYISLGSLRFPATGSPKSCVYKSTQ